MKHIPLTLCLYWHLRQPLQISLDQHFKSWTGRRSIRVPPCFTIFGIRLRPRLPLPSLRAVDDRVVVAVGGLHDVEVGPMGIRQIGKVRQPVRVFHDVGLIRAAAQHAVHDSRRLGAGDRGVGAEGAVRIPGDPAVFDRADHIIVVPRLRRHIAEDVAAAGTQLGKAHGDRCELRPGDAPARREAAAAHPVEYAEGGQRVDRIGVPGAVVHVGKADGDGDVLVQQQVVEHLGGFGPGHIAVGDEQPAGIAAQVLDVAGGIEPP